MKIRYLLPVAVVVMLLVTAAPASWSQPPLPEKPVPSGEEEIIQTSSLTLDRPLPTEEVVRQGVQSTLAGWTTLMTEDFEGIFPSTGWTAFDYDGITNDEYYWDDDSYRPHWGAWSAWCADEGANGLRTCLRIRPRCASALS